MELTTIAKPYAGAIYEIAQSNTGGNTFEAWQKTLDSLGAMSLSAESRELISSPKLSKEQKVAFIEQTLASITGKEVSAFEHNFVNLLIDNDRFIASSSIASLFKALATSGNKSKNISVISAYELTTAEQESITAALTQKFACDIVLETSVDANLVGGIIVKDGDKVIDLSISASVEKLAACLH